MKRIFSIVWGVLPWVVIVGYLIIVSRYCHVQQEQLLCRGLCVRVLDSAERGFVTSSMVVDWLTTRNGDSLREPVAKINTLEIEKKLIQQYQFIESVHAYTSMDGLLNIEITQRKPILRVNSTNGYDFYVTDDHYILPTQRHYSTYVPIVTGTVELPFDRNYVGKLDDCLEQDEKKVSENDSFLANLINFVKFVEHDNFWKAFWVQINVCDGASRGSEGPCIELVPRAGDQIVCLGTLDDYRSKLDKLMRFYRYGLMYEGWENCRYINLAYRGQVVCSNQGRLPQ